MSGVESKGLNSVVTLDHDGGACNAISKSRVSVRLHGFSHICISIMGMILSGLTKLIGFQVPAIGCRDVSSVKVSLCRHFVHGVNNRDDVPVFWTFMFIEVLRMTILGTSPFVKPCLFVVVYCLQSHFSRLWQN